MLSDKKKFERLADKLLRLADSMSHAQDLKDGRSSQSFQARHQSLLILDSVIKALKSLLE